ncbi:MAG TPA: hypothetical protein DCM64_10540 [Gammaproteobacteria bacterium]|nr:hypothetical protein [Gammaproteobacteria bacterium]
MGCAGLPNFITYSALASGYDSRSQKIEMPSILREKTATRTQSEMRTLFVNKFPSIYRSCCGLLLLGGILFSTSGGAQDYRIAHCYQGCPLGADSDNQLIIRPIYALSYNTERKSADWVAYTVSAGSIGIASSLSRQVIADNFVSETLVAEDFADSESLGLVRSHYVPLVDFAATPYWEDVNYLTNSVARSSGLNQGAWYGLDWAIRNLVNRGGEVYVLTGPVYKPEPQVESLLTDTPHRVPDAFFKIVITATGLGAAFIFDQDSAVHVHHCEMRATIDEVERATGLRLFPDQSRPIAGSAYAELGCVESSG